MLSPTDESAAGGILVSADGSAWHEVSAPVSSIDVEDHEYLTDKATILLDDHTGVLAHASFEGLELRVRLGWNLDRQTIFEGVVTGARSVTQREGPQVELTALDFTYRMSRRTPEPFTWNRGQKLSEVVGSIVSRAQYDIKPKQIEPSIDVAFSATNPLVQANQSDWDFVQSLARRYNCRAFVEFDGKDSTEFFFVPVEKLASAPTALNLRCCRGLGGLISFDYERISSGSMVELTATAVDRSTGATTTVEPPPRPPLPAVPPAATDRDRDLTRGQRVAIQALTELGAAAAAKIAADRRRVGGDAADPAAAAASTMPDPTRRVGLSGNGVANGNVGLRAKNRVDISGIAPWAEGHWYVTKVNHVYTRQRLGTRYSSSYVSNFRVTM